MSTLLSAKQVSYHTTSGPLLDDITFTVSRGDRIGLVGHNGCGKSTLLKLLTGKITAEEGDISLAKHCHIEYIEQHLPPALSALTIHQAVSERLSDEEKQTDIWRVDVLLNEMGFNQADMSLTAGTLSGGEHTRLLLARALINNPDLLLLDEPSNHMDLPTLFWLERFLKAFKGGFLLVSHDQKLLDAVTDATWIMRDRTLHSFGLPCSAARTELSAMDEADEARFKEEQKEIDRVAKSAKRLAVWGHTYDNEDLSRKAKTMEKRVEALKASQTELSEGTPWQLKLKGTALPANRLLEVNNVEVRPADDAEALYLTPELQLKSGDKVAILGQNGTGKSSLLRMLWQQFSALQDDERRPLLDEAIRLHPKSKLGYYDQSLQQLNDRQTLMEALSEFAPLPTESLKMALIKAGFPYARHQQTVEGLSGGERSRLLFVGLTLADYHMLMLDEPTNHLDLEGKEELADSIREFAGGLILVSHDRSLIEASCNRFWLVKDGKLEEWHDLDKVYAELVEVSTLHPSLQKASPAAKESPSPGFDLTDDLLEKLIELETLLEADLNRKPRHQKVQQQQIWQKEIDYIKTSLSM